MDDMLAAVVDVMQREVKDGAFSSQALRLGRILRGVLARLGERIDGVLLRALLIVTVIWRER
ncbi:hypothetical protein [Mesorhizobium sp. 113-3-3]|uniref:hypothetical protein n=1 Tax=Mesorhizobium sp. 113-3-3 TaxID=2744516 RepID=UPI0018EA34B8|nr:hypothetical protein [Mesorhizobium sp. 113-3-3]